MRTINGLVTRVEHVEQRPPPRWHRRQPYGDEDDENEDADLDDDARAADRLWCNRQGMGGNQNRGNNDPFAKAKFTMIPFAGTADPKAYLDSNLLLNKNLILI